MQRTFLRFSLSSALVGGAVLLPLTALAAPCAGEVREAGSTQGQGYPSRDAAVAVAAINAYNSGSLQCSGDCSNGKCTLNVTDVTVISTPKFGPGGRTWTANVRLRGSCGCR